MEKQHSLLFLIKNKALILMVLFLIGIARTARIRAFTGYFTGIITYRQTKKLLNFASDIHRISIRLLRFITPAVHKRGI